MISSLESYTLEKFFSGFCLDAPFENIYTQNCDEFLAWAVYVSTFTNLNPDERGVITSLRCEASKYLQKDFVNGKNPVVKTTKFHLEEVSYLHHPLCLVLLIYAVNFLLMIWPIYLNGFKYYRTANGIGYWYCDNGNIERENKDPILLLHGVSTGLGYYGKLITSLMENHTRSIVIIEYTWVNLGAIPSHTSPAPGPLELQSAFKEICKCHNIKSVSIVAHSWGTFLAGWLLRLCPRNISHVTLVDPACLTTVLPENTYNLLYKQPCTFSDYVLVYMVRNDLNLSFTLRRHFAWYNAALELDAVPDSVGVVVAIGAADELMCAAAAFELVGIASDRRKEIPPSNEKVATIRRLIWDSCAHGEIITSDTIISELKIAMDENENYQDIDNNFKLSN